MSEGKPESVTQSNLRLQTQAQATAAMRGRAGKPGWPGGCADQDVRCAFKGGLGRSAPGGGPRPRFRTAVLRVGSQL